MTKPQVWLRDARVEDVPALVVLEASCGGRWEEAAFTAELRCSWSRQRVAWEVGERMGFCIWWAVADEAQLLNIGVAPAARRRGVGRLLLEDLMQRARQDGLGRVSLEVRRGNGAAQALYTALAFESVALRPRYYPDNNEDAVLMQRQL